MYLYWSKCEKMNNNKKSKERKKQKRLLYLFGSILFVIALLGVIILFTGNKTDQSTRRKINSLPIILDDYTRVDSVFEVGKNKMNYYLTINAMAEDIDLSKNANIVVDNIIQSIRNDKDYNKWFNKQVVFEYRYFDKSGKLFFMKTITPSMYKRQ